MKRLFILAGVLSLASSGSTPSYHYTLSPNGSTLSAPVAIKVGPYALAEVTIPPEVDQDALVVQQSDGQLLKLGFDRWTAPLSGHLRTALSLELTSRLGMPPVQNLTAGLREAGVTQVQVDVQRFDLVPGKSVTLTALWRITFASPKQILTCFTQLEQPVGPGVPALVNGQQKNTQQLSDQIARALIQRSAPTGATCSAG